MEPETPSPRVDTDVLVVGAGPTGLVLALWLRRLGVRVRIVDMREGPGETSRALAVQARTLEFYRQIGIVDDVLAAGLRIDQLTIRTPAGVAAAPQAWRIRGRPQSVLLSPSPCPRTSTSGS